MEVEPKPDDSKSTSQTAGIGENHQIPTPPSEEDPASHGTEPTTSEKPRDSDTLAQHTDGGNTIVVEDAQDAKDNKSDAGSNAGSVIDELPPGKWDYPYLARIPKLPPGTEFNYSEPPGLLNTGLKQRQDLKTKHDEYIMLLEDRITRLENKLTKFLTKPPKMPPPPPKFMFVPELRELSWKDWVQTIGMSGNDGHSTIEILVDLPTSRGRETSLDQKCQDNDLRSPEQQQGLQGVQPSATRLRKDAADLPERMRINTGILLTIMDRDVMDKGAIDTLPPLILRRPYKAFVYYKDAILERIDELKSKLEPEALERAQKQIDQPEKRELPMPTATDDEFHYLLYSLIGNFINNYLSPVIERVPGQSRIQFHELWFLFHPGQYVYVRDKQTPQSIWCVMQTAGGNRYLRKPGRDSQRRSARRQRSPSYSRSPSISPPPPGVRMRRSYVGMPDFSLPPPAIVEERLRSNYPLNEFSPFQIDCYYIDYDGYVFKPVARRFEIQKFEDNVPIKTLNVMPLDMAEEAGLVKKEERRKIGEQYLECIKATHRFFDGRTLDRNSDGDTLYLQESEEWRNERRAFPENLEGKVMVDLTTAVQANPGWYVS